MAKVPDILFKGVPRRYTRGYTAEAVKELKPSAVCIPCVGAFALASAVAQTGFPPGKIATCDISLYSSVIGAYLSGGEIDVRPIGDFTWLEPFMQDPIGKVAGVVLAIRELQYRSKRDTIYYRDHVTELRTNAPLYLAAARAAAESMYQILGGIKYAPRDMSELIGEYYDDPAALILCNPPRYTGGYDKMYAGVEEAFDWRPPAVAQFTEEDYPNLVDWLGQAPAKAFIYYATPVVSAENPEDLFGPPWRSVFAARPRTGKTSAINWIVSNKKLPSKLHRQDVKDLPDAKYKLFTTGEITPDSDLRIVTEKQDVVNYYRDLFVHNLSMINTERYCVMLLDGQLMAVCGFHMSDFHTSTGGGSGSGIHLTFCFTPEHEKYHRIQKLALMSVLSTWLWEGRLTDIDPMPTDIQTTMLTYRPEVKTARGTGFNLTAREQQGSRYKLTYYGLVVERTAKQTIEEWLSKHANE